MQMIHTSEEYIREAVFHTSDHRATGGEKSTTTKQRENEATGVSQSCQFGSLCCQV